MWKALMCAFFALQAASRAAAADSAISPETSCTIAVAAFHTKDMPTINEVGTFMQNVFDELDAGHTDNGEPGIMARMNDHGVASMVAMAVAFCRDHPQATIFSEAANTYRAYRAIEMQFGVAK
jgi:hypothetical protein